MSLENSSDRHPGTIEYLLRLPRNLSDLVGELRRLNNHLETLPIETLPTNLNKVTELTEVLKDFRTMIAPVLGWRVKEDPPKEINK